MATQHSKPGQRLHQPKNGIPSDEAFWQQMMVLNYALYEAIDAMEQERASGHHTPLNRHWQQFIYHLRRRKPTLNQCLDLTVA